MEIYRNKWKYIEMNGNTWKYMEIHGNTWKYVEIHGNMLKYVVKAFMHVLQHSPSIPEGRGPGGGFVRVKSIEQQSSKLSDPALRSGQAMKHRRHIGTKEQRHKE